MTTWTELMELANEVLTERQKDVLILRATGHSFLSISYQLDISEQRARRIEARAMQLMKIALEKEAA